MGGRSVDGATRIPEVSGDTTRTPSGRGSSLTLPSGPMVDLMIRGGIRTPSLAMVWYIPVICSSVIERPCPMGRLENVLPDHWAMGGTSPSLSPGRPTSVRCPSPNFSSMSKYFSGPIRWLSISVPTLDDFPRTPVVVYGMTPCFQASLTVTPPMSIEPGTCNTSSGVVSPFSMAVEMATILLTDPGSNGEDTARLPICRSA